MRPFGSAEFILAGNPQLVVLDSRSGSGGKVGKLNSKPIRSTNVLADGSKGARSPARKW